MSIKQISIFLENKPGQLNELTGVLSKNNIDMRALSLVETKDFGIARIIVDDAFSAMDILKNADFIAKLTSVLAIEIPDETGGLNNILNVISDAGVNIEYMYAFNGGADVNHAYMIFRVADTKAAEVRLSAKGLKILTEDDMIKL